MLLVFTKTDQFRRQIVAKSSTELKYHQDQKQNHQNQTKSTSNLHKFLQKCKTEKESATKCNTQTFPQQPTEPEKQLLGGEIWGASGFEVLYLLPT